MAKCDLSIELDQPDAVHPAGGTIAGVVRVVVDADVKCNGLEVQSGWRTHGRGNIASGTAGTTTLFAGQWREGETHEYRFELPIAPWPPTYHGHYLNVDHFVDARAKIPWGFDPKAAAPFLVRPTSVGDEAQVRMPASEMSNVVGRIIGFLVFGFMIAFFSGFAVAGPFSLIFLIFPALGFLYWFIRKYLPRWILGDVVAQFPVAAISPGQAVEGELLIKPNKRVAINGITMLFTAREECISGSGSNRTTHKHVFFEKTEVLQEATTLNPGERRHFALPVELPSDAPHTLSLDDNKLIWSATLRVDIPRWPDWVREIPLTVVPAPQPARATDSASGRPSTTAAARASADGGYVRDWAASGQPGLGAAGNAEIVPGLASEPEASPNAEVTFSETVSHLWAYRDQRDQVEMLVEAVMGIPFDLEAIVERRLLYTGDEDPHVYKDGYAVWAHYPDPPLPMVLYVPGSLADDFEQVGRDIWRGRGTVVGWDSRHGRLQVKLE